MPPNGISDAPAPVAGVDLGVLSPEQVTEAREKARTAADAAQYQQKPEMDALAKLVQDAYAANKQFRSEEIDALMLEDLRQLNGEYDPDKLADLKRANHPVIFMPATGEKCRGAIAYVSDVLNFDNDKPFTLKPTPLPDLPPDAEQAIKDQVKADVQAYLQAGNDATPSMIFKYAAMMRDQIEADLLEEAKDRAKRMETKIFDQMIEGGWRTAFRGCLRNLVWAPAAYIKGPIMRRVTTKKYVQGPFGTYVKRVKTIKPTFEAPSPFDIYPSREAVTTDDGELCERIKLSVTKLGLLRGVPGYQDKAIDKVIAEYGKGSYELNNTDAERYRLEGKGATATTEGKSFVEGVEYWGEAPGHLLKEKGVKEDALGDPLNDLDVYESNIILVGDNVIYAAVNPDVEGHRPYMKACWEEKEGAFYGKGIPRIMRELQQVINATIRSLCMDMASTTGFQTIINDMTRIPPGENVTETFPGKLWQFLKSNYGNSEKVLDFWQPASVAATLLRVYETFEPKIDNITGVPRYEQGSASTSAAGRTYGGLMALMSNSARGIKMVLSRIDEDIYRPAVNKLFDYNMVYGADESIKGDVVIQCSGALSQIVNEQNSQRIMQMLTATANPADQVIVGPRERGALWREFSKQLQLPKDLVVKSDDEIQRTLAEQEREMAAQQQEATAGQGGQPQQVQTA